MNNSRSSDHLTLSDLHRIIEARRDYQHSFRAGGAPSIEHYLVGLLEPDRSDIFKELLSLEIELRQGSGQTVMPDEYLVRFPEYEHLINRTFRRNTDSMPQFFGDYEVIRELGRGGMGIVYEARHRSLDRRVAVKVLPTAGMLDVRGRVRFRNEARAAAQLDHPHIVPVYSIGVENGLDFYVMHYIQGQNLAQLARSVRPTVAIKKQEQPGGSNGHSEDIGSTDNWDAAEPEHSPVVGNLDTKKFGELASTHRSTSDGKYFRYIAKLFLNVANALQHAHDLGIVHRDIKPSNLMLDSNDHIWVTDFGLAQIQGEPELTFTGDVVGTLRYMSPEQALAKRVVVDHRTDIYSFGVTLYEMLTFRAAYDGHSREEVLRQIAFEDPPPPRKIARALPHDLDTIILKCIQKRPDDRYQTAKAVAEDLQRFLDNEPILAEPPSLWERLKKWAQRHRALVASLIAIWITFFAAALVISIVMWNANSKTRQALHEKTKLSERLAKEKSNTQQALNEKTRTAQQLSEQKAQKEQLLLAEARLRTELEGSLKVSQAQELVARSMAVLNQDPAKSLLLANLAATAHQSVAVRDALNAAIMAIHEHKLLKHDADNVIIACRFSPDGRLLATIANKKDSSGNGDTPNSLLIWDIETSTRVATIADGSHITAALFADNRHLLVASVAKDHTVLPPSMWSASATGQWANTASVVYSGAILSQSHPGVFHPDQQRLVLPAETTARIYDISNAEDFSSLDHEGQSVRYAAYGPHGRRIITVAEDAKGSSVVRVFDADRRTTILKKEFPPIGDPIGGGSIDSVQIHPAQDILLTASVRGGVELWNLADGARLNAGLWNGSTAYFADAGDKVVCIQPYGDKVDVRDTKTGELLRSLNIDDGLSFAAISGDGRRLATVGGDTSVRVWDLSTLEMISVLRGHTGQIRGLDISIDGARIATGGHDTTARIWNAESRGQKFQIGMPTTGRGPIVEATADNKQLLAITRPRDQVSIWKVGENAESTAVNGISSIRAVEENICLSAVNGRVDAWNPLNGEKVGSLKLPGITSLSAAKRLTISQASGWAAVGLSDGRIVLWNPANNQRRFLQPRRSQINILVMSADGQWLVAASDDGAVRVWSTADGTLAHEWTHPEKVIDLCISPTGNRLAGVTNRHTAYVWDLNTFEQLATVAKDGRNFDEALFSRQGDYLLTLSSDKGDVSVWDPRTGDFLRGYDELTGVSRFAHHPEEDEWVAICAQGSEKGEGSGARLWNYVRGEILRLSDRPVAGIAIGKQKVVAVVRSPAANNAAASTLPDADPFRYTADNMMPLDGKYDLSSWNMAGEQLSSQEIDVDATRVYYLASSNLALIQCRQHGFAAYSREENELQYMAFGHSGRLADIISTPSNVITAGYDGALIVWERATGNRSTQMQLAAPILDIDANPEQPLQIATAAADGTVHIWNILDGSSTAVLPKGHGQAWFVQFDKTGKRLLSVYRDGQVILTDLAGDGSNQQRALSSEHHSLNRAEFSPDGSKLLTVEGDDYEPGTLQPRPFTSGENEKQFMVRIYSTERMNDAPLAELPHQSAVRFAHFDAKGENVISVEMSGEIALWQVDSGKKVRRIGQAVQSDHYGRFTPRSEDIYAEFSPDGQLIYVEFSDYSGVSDYAFLFGAKDGEAILNLPSVHATRAAVTYPRGDVSHVFTPDSQWILPGFGERALYGFDMQQVRKTPVRPIDYGKQIEPRQLTRDELLGLEIIDQPGG